jgi:AcrR family transcriptional regulator
MSRAQIENSANKMPRRQARGQKRIAELLRAAGEVFAEVGYENATTNAIAARAGVSPGTLYQFFSNKQAIAEALASDYAARDKAAHDEATQTEIARLPLSELVDRVIDPFLDFRKKAPGFDALFTGSSVSPELAARIQMLHEELKRRVAEMISIRLPDLPARELQTYAEVSIQIVKGLLPLAMNGTVAQRKAGVRQMKTVLERYLAPLDADSQSRPTKARKHK